MKNRILTGFALVFLASTTDAWGQAAIPECRTAVQTLKYYGSFANVGTLIQKDCPDMYKAGWLTGTGTLIQTKNADGSITYSSPIGCDGAWTNLNSNASVLAAAKEFVTRNCPDAYYVGWRAGPQATAPIPACDAALNNLNALGKAAQAGNALKNRCIQLYQNSWLIQIGGGTNTCPVIWDGLTTSGALVPARELITRNCPWLYANSYVTKGSPIQP